MLEFSSAVLLAPSPSLYHQLQDMHKI